jgi:hypothetical protein
MKIRNTLVSFALFAISMVAWSGTASAQEESEEQGNIFLVATFYVNVPEDGSMEEMQEMLAEQTEATKEDSREWVVITEYESLAAMDEAFEIDEQLIEARWPDEEEREAWQDKLNSYFEKHSDAIYNGVPNLSR